MKVKDLLQQLKNADPEAEIDLEGEVGDVSNVSFEEEMKKVNKRGKKSRMIFFFERPDGVIVQCDERQAYTYQYEYKPSWKQIGCSDGKQYWEATKEARKALQVVQDRLKQLERMKIAPKQRDFIALEKASEHFNEVNGEAIKKELEIARGHFRVPFNNQWIGSARAVKVAKNRLGLGIQE